MELTLRMPNLTLTLQQGGHVRIGDAIIVTVVGFSVQESRSGRLYPQVIIAIEAPDSTPIDRNGGAK